jgi:hypothetical protein
VPLARGDPRGPEGDRNPHDDEENRPQPHFGPPSRMYAVSFQPLSPRERATSSYRSHDSFRHADENDVTSDGPVYYSSACSTS